MKKRRKQNTPEEKVAILRRHLLEKEPISKLCDELGLQPKVFYRWQKEFSRTGHLPSSRRGQAITPPSRSESRTWRRKSRRKMRFWPNRWAGIGSWRRPENSARFVGRRLREKRRATFTVAGETHNFRVADNPDAIREASLQRLARYTSQGRARVPKRVLCLRAVIALGRCMLFVGDCTWEWP